MKDVYHFHNHGPDGCMEYCSPFDLCEDSYESTWTPEDFDEIQKIEKQLCVTLLVLVISLMMVCFAAVAIKHYIDNSTPSSIENVIDESEDSLSTVPTDEKL